MNKAQQLWTMAILVLMIIGVIYNPRPLIIPAVLIGIVALLYFYPPNRWSHLLTRLKGNTRATRSTPKSREFERRSRKAKFRVIEGNKTDDSDEPPRYH